MQQPVSACSAHSRELTSLSRYSRSSCPKSRHVLRRCLRDELVRVRYSSLPVQWPVRWQRSSSWSLARVQPVAGVACSHDSHA